MRLPLQRCRYAALLALFAVDLCNVKALLAAEHSTRPVHANAQVKTADPSVPVDNAQALPASVSLKDGKLTVDAHNSDLDQILKDVARIGGMTVDGTPGNARIFGVYAGNPRDVLSSLLTGSGRNYIMVGNAHDGVPRELLLSVNHGGPSVTAHAPASVDHEETPDADAPEQDQPGPGAIIHVPPSGPDDQQERMQQNLQRLAHIRGQQEAQPQ